MQQRTGELFQAFVGRLPRPAWAHKCTIISSAPGSPFTCQTSPRNKGPEFFPLLFSSFIKAKQSSLILPWRKQNCDLSFVFA